MDCLQSAVYTESIYDTASTVNSRMQRKSCVSERFMHQRIDITTHASA
jgi:hypothetical protein